jgi:tetrahydromethanopterin S-methyltransferase subunit A
MLKVAPAEGHPLEPGCYLRGNDYSPVAVVILMNDTYSSLPPALHKTPPAFERLVRAAIESGAALAGTLQTENIGLEKVICNVVGNPNIRYLVLCGREVDGHQTGTAVRALLANGVDERRTIIGSQALTPYLFNVPLEAIARFRQQVTLVDLVGEMEPEVVIQAVWSCYQEEPTAFHDYALYDPGAFPGGPLAATLSGAVAHPERVEPWEVEDIIQRIERGEPVTAEGPPAHGGGVMLSEEKLALIGQRLARVADELAEIARLFTPDGRQSAPTVAEGPDVEAMVLTAVSAEGRRLANHLRAWNAALGGLVACDHDVCHDGCSLPAFVIKSRKQLGKLRDEIVPAPVPPQERTALQQTADALLDILAGLPDDLKKPCQKTVGTCQIGKACFAQAALEFVKLAEEAPSPAVKPEPTTETQPCCGDAADEPMGTVAAGEP